MPDPLEFSILDLILHGVGLRLCLVPIDEPVLGLGFNYLDDLQPLLEFSRARSAAA